MLRHTAEDPTATSLAALAAHKAAVASIRQLLRSRRPLLDQSTIRADVARNAIYVACHRAREQMVRAATVIDPADAAADANDAAYDFTAEHNAALAKLDEILTWFRTNFDLNNAWDYDPAAVDGLVQRTYRKAELTPLAALLDELDLLIAP